MAAGGYTLSNGYNISVGTEKILGTSQHSIGGEFIFQGKDYTTKTTLPEPFKVNSYLVQVNYTYTLEQLLFNQLYVGFSAGFIGGYEEIKDNLNTAKLTEKDKGIYGGIAGIRAEYSFVRNFSLFIEPRILYTTSSFKEFMFNPIMGIKYYL